MLEKIKNLGNLPLVIILIIVIIIAIVLSIFKTQKTEEINYNADADNIAINEEENNLEQEEQQEEIIFEENVQEILDETEEEKEYEDAKYFIKVNYGQNVVTIYTKDGNGKYTVPYKAMVCSTGTATPRSGTYTIPSGSYSRGAWGMMIGNVWAQYFTRIKGSILFHSVPYTDRNKWSLEYWEYDKLGTAASAGCIRLTVQDAKWIYNNCPAGTQVEFYTDSNPGPLGKPTAQKISEEETVRGWDPTDPDATNPWKTYTPEQEEPNDNEVTTKPSAPTTTTKPTTPVTPTEPEETPEQNPEEEKTNIEQPTHGEEEKTEDSGATEEPTNPDNGDTPDAGEDTPTDSENDSGNNEEDNSEELGKEDETTSSGENEQENNIAENTVTL